MNPTEDYEDVEIYIRRPGVEKGSDGEKCVWSATYREMARLSNRFVVEAITETQLEKGEWVIGLRERGDEQYSQRFQITPLVADQADHEVQNRVAALLNHWRQ
ncbi:hypothetical protein [Natrialba aegyptia]|uniref:hypothetical protein n=1 Tax=Natrialba aegyptia TaxID=129789 RepID=UPI00403B3770